MATANPHDQPILVRWTPSLPTNLVSMLNPFATGDNNPTDNNKQPQHTTLIGKQPSETAEGPQISLLARPILAAFTHNANVSRQSSPSRTSSDMFAEPEGSSENSRDNSVDGSRRAKKSVRPKTRFSVCHPPPASTTRQKLHRRPRPLLQLHRLSAHARPLPAFEIIPSANFSVRLTRTIAKLFKAKHSLCPNDLVIMQAESYGGDETDEEQEERNVIGLICNGRKDDDRTAGGKARIYLTRGQEWEAYPTINSGYEFFTTDEHGLGLTLRWVPKKYKDGKGPKDGSRTFNFSTISPNSRRHPVIASLSKTALDINDKYKMPDPAAVTPLSTPKQGGTFLADTMEEEGGDEFAYETDDKLREIITMTAIWVTFKEGWSPYMKLEDKEKDCVPHSPSRHCPSPVPSAPGSPAHAPMLEKRSSIKSVSSSIFRRPSGLRSNRNSTVSMPDDDDAKRSGSMQRTGRARADSSSTVLVHRAASNRRKNNQQASWRPEHLSADQPIHEVSHENLARDAASMAPVAKAPSPLAATQPRKESAAQPLIPDGADDEDDEDDEDDRSRAETPSPDERRELEDEPVVEKESTTTSSSSHGTAAAQPSASTGKRHRKRRLWRKLLCGGTHDV